MPEPDLEVETETVNAPAAADVPPAPESERPGRLALVLLGLLVLSPVLAVLITRAWRPYFPVGDPANIDLFVRDVFGGHPPLVGAYSRGFNHPGPSMFWAIAPVSVLAGGDAWGTLVGAALLQGVAILGVGWVALRRGGTALMLLMLAALALVYSGFGQGGQFVVPWNPYVPVPCFLLFLLSTWAFANGDRGLVVVAVVTGSFVVQAHMGYTPLVLAALAWGVIVVVVDHTRGSATATTGPRWRTVTGWAVVALVVMWIAPLVQQFRDEPGNLEEIWHYFGSGEASVGLRTGAGLLATEFKVLPPWLGGRETFAFGSRIAEPSSIAWLLVPVVLLAAGFVSARRSGRIGDRRLVELSGLTAVVSVITLSRISVEASPYLFYWRIVVAAFLVAACAYAIANSLRVMARPHARVACAVVLLGAMVIGFGGQVLDVVNHSDRVATAEAATEHLVDQLRARGLPTGPVLVRGLGNVLGGADQGVVDALDRAGVDVRVDPRFAYRFGSQRAATADEVGEVWYVSEEGHDLSLLPGRDGARLLASSSPLTPAEERELQGLQQQAAAALTAAGEADRIPELDSSFLVLLAERQPLPGVSPDDVARMAALNQKVFDSRTCRCSVVAVPATAPPLGEASM